MGIFDNFSEFLSLALLLLHIPLETLIKIIPSGIGFFSQSAYNTLEWFCFIRNFKINYKRGWDLCIR